MTDPDIKAAADALQALEWWRGEFADSMAVAAVCCRAARPKMWLRLTEENERLEKRHGQIDAHQKRVVDQLEAEICRLNGLLEWSGIDCINENRALKAEIQRLTQHLSPKE